MSAPINDGGPAFPRADGPYCTPQDGMTLRDYFAGQALAGILSDPNLVESTASTAQTCYHYADAMIAARGGAK